MPRLSEMARQLAPAVLLSFGTAASCLHAAEPDDPLGEKTGGATTVYANGKNAFSFPLANLDDDERRRFAIGNSFFKRNWVEAPASTTARDGLGPHFIARSCAGCHTFDGRGAPPDHGRTLDPDPEATVALLLRLSIPGQPRGNAGVVPEPTYGDQFNNAAIQGVRPEGRVRIRSATIKGSFADGTPYTLQQPIYELTDLAYGPMAQDVMISPRIAPQLAGIGLLEAISEADILRNAADQAASDGPVKGQVNRVWDVFAGAERVGRFGWKANVASIASQTAGAFNGDIGITSRRLPNESCTPTQVDCLDAPHGGGKRAGVSALTAARNATAEVPEIDDATLNHTIFYQATLAPAARRKAKDKTVLRGQVLFAKARCSSCHRPSYVTAENPSSRWTSSKLQGQKIWPYTDLLLHDMGPNLADGRPDFQANGRQWKTPPLWGVGLVQEVNGHQRLLHDGRANGVLEAILWHGGEAQSSQQEVLKMNAADRQALVRFVESL